MANVLSLAVKIAADSTQLKLSPAERALRRLGEETEKVTAVFDRFTSTSTAAARAQADTARALDDLVAARRSGTISAEAFAAGFERVRTSAQAEATALEQAARITEANRTPTERFARAQAELQRQLDAGRITQETFSRAVEAAARGLTDAERAALGLAAGAREITRAGGENVLRFNELSGVLAVLPGPLGSIAGRLSGLASASEGLARVFAGGLGQGVGNLVASFTALVNPLTAALAGVTAFAAAATGVTRGLVSLEDRVERLGNLSKQLGVSFEFVQVLEEAGSRTGVAVQTVSTAFGRLQRTLAAGGQESERVNRSLRNLGVTITDLNGLTEQQRFELIGRQLTGIEDPAKRAAAAIELFGRQGLSLLPFFENLDRAGASVRKFDAAISDVDRTRIDELGNAFDDVKTALQGLSLNLLVPFAGLVEGISNAIANSLGVVTNAIRPLVERIQPVLDSVGRSLSRFGEAIFASSGRLTQPLERLGELVGRVFGVLLAAVRQAEPGVRAAFAAVASAVQTIADTVTGSFAAVLGVLESVAGAFGRLLGFDGLVSFARGLGEAYGFLYASIAPVITATGEFLAITSRLATVVVVAIGRAIESVIELTRRFLEFTGLGRTLAAVGGAIAGVFERVAGVFGTIATAIGGTVGRLLSLTEGFVGIDRSAREAAAATTRIADAAREVSRQKEIQLAQSKRLAEEADRRAALAEEESKAVERLVQAYLESVRIEEEFGGDSARAKAADNLLKIQNEIARVEQELAIARRDGDRQAADGLAARLATLDRIAAREDDIARGAKRARDEAAKAAEDLLRQAEGQAREDAERISRLLDSGRRQTQTEENILAIRREQRRLADGIAEAAARGDLATADVRRRLVELDELLARQQDLRNAQIQGFAEGYESVFRGLNERLAEAAREAREFGDAGASAAARLEAGIARAQQLARAGFLSREAFDAEVARQQDLFERQLSGVRELAAERRRVNDLVDSQLELARFGGDARRLAAARNLAALEGEIARVQEEARRARAVGDRAAVTAAVERLAQLDQVAAGERDIVTGRIEGEARIAREREEFLRQITAQEEEQATQARKFQEQLIARQQEASAREFDRQRERIAALSTLGGQVITGADIRTQAGARLFQQLASQRQDPLLVEARLQNRRLREVVAGIGELLDRFGVPVVQIGAGVG